MSKTKNGIVVYQSSKTMRLDVRLEKEMVWLNRHQMAQLFGRDSVPPPACCAVPEPYEPCPA